MELTACRELKVPAQGLLPAGRFRFGQRIASVRADDAAFRERFLRLYFDCLEPSGRGLGSRAVRLDVFRGRSQDSVQVEISEHSDDFDPGIVEMLIPELRLTSVNCAVPGGWRVYAGPDDPSEPVLAAREGRLILDARLPWQLLAGHYFVHHVMRLQPDVLFLHAASLVVGGRGILLCGNKAHGKSTLALALAARGHGFLGDEIAAIHARTGTSLPFRRTVSIREGPQDDRVKAFLARREPDRETLADGSTRVRVRMSEVFPDAPAPRASLSDALFLCGFSERPRAEAFEFSTNDLHRLGPLQATFTGRPAGGRALELLKLFAQVRCYRIWVGGTPQQTARLIEQVLEGEWATVSSKRPNPSERFGG